MVWIEATRSVTTIRKTTKILLVIVILTTEKEAFRFIFAIISLASAVHLYSTRQRLIGEVGCHTNLISPQVFITITIELMTKEQFHVMMAEVMVVINELLEVIRVGLIACT